MGLTAVVYKQKEHINLGADEKLAVVIPQTGEVYFEDDDLSRKYGHQLCAMKDRLGNVTEIEALREEIIRSIGPDSIIVEKILYSGYHSGDAIPVEALSILSSELDSISATAVSPEVQRFAASLEKLIKASKDERNPIVFV